MRRSILVVIAGCMCAMWTAAADAQTAAASPSQQTAVRPTPAASLTVVPKGVDTPPDYVIGPDDVLSIVFWRDKEMSDDVAVRPDGKISLPLINEVQASGLTPE